MMRATEQNGWSTLVSAIVVTSVICLVLLAYGATFLTVRDAHSRARTGFDQAQTDLQETERSRQLLESRIESLRTHVDAVRLQARNEFRLIMPGERIEVIAIDKSSDLSPRVVATTLP